MKRVVIIVVLFIVVSGFLLFTLGFNHIVTGAGFKYPRFVQKEHFGFKETFINLDNIKGMAWEDAKAIYPQSFNALQYAGFVWKEKTKRPLNPPTSPQTHDSSTAQ